MWRRGEFCLQDAGVSGGFTHKMAAWKNCLQDGGNAKQTKRKQNNVEYVLLLRLQCRIYLVNVTWPSDSSMSDVRHWTVWRSTMTRWTFDNAGRQVTAFRPISEAARSWSCDNIISQWRLYRDHSLCDVTSPYMFAPYPSSEKAILLGCDVGSYPRRNGPFTRMSAITKSADVRQRCRLAPNYCGRLRLFKPV